MPIFDNSGVVTDPNAKPSDLSTAGQKVDITTPNKTDITESQSNNMILYVLGAIAVYYFLIKKK